MNRTEAEAKLEFLETSEDARAAGLRRIKRRHLTKSGEVTLKDCKVTVEIEIDADVLEYFKDKAGAANYKAQINSVLREQMENASKAEMKRIRRELLDDAEFLQELKEKLAA